MVSQFAGPGTALDTYYSAGISNTGIVSAYAGAGVTNPELAVDNSLTNYAHFNSLATVSCPSALAGGRAPGGFYAGFVIGNAGLLDASVLSGLRVTTYRNGLPTGESAIGAGLLELRALPDGKSQVSFSTKLPLDEVKIERVAALSALDNLRLFYGFGVEPRAFAATTEVLSNFALGQTAGTYEVNSNSVVCLGNCGVANPQYATDNDPTTSATLTMPTALLPTVKLKLNLNGAGAAGNRAGMAVGDGQNLLDASVLDRLSLTTYDAAGNVLGNASACSLLSLNLLPDGRQEISFLTTRPFTSVQLSASAGASALTSFPIHYAFADNRSGGLPSTFTPLPVELTAFVARWANGGAVLTWTTASEKNSRHFVIERSTGAEAGFEAVDKVAVTGNSTRPLSYQMRDAKAGRQNAAVLYYRLRQADADGKEAFSPVVSLAAGKRAAAAPQLEAYPNPAPDAQSVLANCPNLPATGGVVQAYSQLGQLVAQAPVTAVTGRVALPGLKAGLYRLVLRGAAGESLATQRLEISGR